MTIVFKKNHKRKWVKQVALFLCVVLLLAPMRPIAVGAVGGQTDDCSIAYRPSQESGTVGQESGWIAVSEDKKWWGVESKASTTAGAPISIISQQNSVTISSPIEEGYEDFGGKKTSQTAPVFTMQAAWTQFDMANQDLMLYLEMPQTAQGYTSLRMINIVMENWSKFPNPSGMAYSYLAMDGTQWEQGTISTDGTHQINLPDGFRGYLRLKLSTASNAVAEGWDTGKFTLQDLSFYLGAFGGEYGSVKFGGIWYVSKDENLKVTVYDHEKSGGALLGENMAMTDGSSPNRDSISAMMPAAEGSEIGETSGMMDISQDEAWGGIKSQATMVAGPAITVVGTQRSTVVNSPVAEGYRTELGDQRTYATIRMQLGWKELDLASQDLMFYVELPEGSSTIRIQGITANSWGLWPDPAGMTYDYLEVGSGAWIDGVISTDGNKQLQLTEGFKGYVRLQISTASNCADQTKLLLQDVNFYLERFGGDTGVVKFGGVWFVSKNDSTYLRLDGGDKISMVGNVQDNETVQQYRALLDTLGEKDLSVAATLDQLRFLYSSLSQAGKQMITDGELAKIAEFEEMVAPFRAEFWGVSIRGANADPQGMKIGWNVNEEIEGYSVVASGLTMIFEKNYDGKSVIETALEQVIHLQAEKSEDGYYYVTQDIKAEDYDEQLLMRCYTVYESANGEQITIYSGEYINSANESGAYMACSMNDAAKYFIIPLT